MNKGLYAAPAGLDEMDGMDSALEIDIEDPKSVTLDDGSVEIT
jgi:hypothetical protein